MKTIALAILIALSSVALRAEEARLTPAQVEAIAILVTTEIYHVKDFTPSKPTYDKALGIWTCMTSNGMVGAGFLLYIRDKDAYYRVVTGSGKGRIDEFKMHASLKRRIARIIEKEG